MAGINQSELQLAARLAAIEYILTRIFAAATSGATNDEFDRLIENYRAGLETETIEGLDPGLSDLAMSEVRDEVLRLLNAAREIRTRGL